jgi:hypothetical protein
MADKDNRNLVRRHLYYYLNVIDADTNEEIGRVVDITVSGVLIISSREYNGGEKMRGKILIDSDLLFSGDNDLIVDLHCRWSKPDINPEYSVSGFIFTGITDGQTKIINRIIEKIGFRDFE